MASVLDRSFVAAANHVLAGADWARTRLRLHIGKQACVRIGAWSMHVRVGSEGLLEPGDREAISDVTLGMPPQAAARWLVEREAAIRTVQVTGEGAGAFRVHAPDGVHLFSGAAAALDKAKDAARAAARAAVLDMGACEPEIRLSLAKHLLPEAVDDDGLFSASVTAEAIGRPKLE